MKNPHNKADSLKISYSADLKYLKPDEDAPYVERARNGDMDAFEILVKKYEARVYQIASHMLANGEDARDAAQEAFIKAYRSITRFRGESKFSTWLYRIINNVCLDHLRKRNRNALSLDDETVTEGGDKVAREIPSDFDVEAIVENAEFRRLVGKALRSLPEQHRAMIALRDLQGLGYAEISDLLELPEGTVKSRINRARANLRNMILGLEELKEYINVKYNNGKIKL